MNISATVAADLSLRLLVPEHGGVPLTASLYYRGDDPYAIRMTFHVGAGEPVEWIFARELLTRGMNAPAGDGDVRVWPNASPADDILNISLSSPFGQAHFEAPLAAVSGFLLRTFEIVPAEREGEFIDIDGELNFLLRWGLALRSPTTRPPDGQVAERSRPLVHPHVLGRRPPGRAEPPISGRRSAPPPHPRGTAAGRQRW